MMRPQLLKNNENYVVRKAPAKDALPRRVLGDLANKNPQQAPQANLKKTVSNAPTATAVVAKVFPRPPIHVRQPDKFSAEEITLFKSIDAIEDPLMVKNYISDIIAYKKELEKQMPIRKGFLINHKTTPRYRQIVVDWLVSLQGEFKMFPETLHVAVAVFDRYLQLNKDIGKDTLQLVGSTALLIAAKYEEIYPPSLSDLIYTADNAFNRADLKKMEINIVKDLDFKIGRPISLRFLRRFSEAAKATNEQHHMAKYFIDLCLLNYELCHYLPSIQAAAAICLSRAVCGEVKFAQHSWSNSLEYFTGYTYNDISKAIAKLAYVVANASCCKQQEIRDKYATAKFDKVSLNPKLNGTVIRKLGNQSLLSV